jgi:MFS family permease
MRNLIPIPDRNIGIYYILTCAQTASFVSANWIFFWLRLMTYGQLGLVDALGFAFGLLMEIPTGAIADMMSRRRTLMLAYAFAGAGYLVMAASDAAWVLILGFWLTQIGWAFYSGAAEALAFDSLKELGQEAQYPRVASTVNMLGIIAFIAALLIGGVMYNVDVRLPHYACGIALLIGMGAAFWLREPKVGAVATFSLRTYRKQLTQGFRQLVMPDLRQYVGLIFAALGGMFLFSFGLIQPAIATSFGFLADEQAVVYALLATIAALLMPLVPPLRKRFSDFTGLAVLTLLLAAGFAGAALPLGGWGVVALLCIRVGGEMSRTWVSIVLNERIPSETRATTLSTVALLSRIPYVLTALIAGVMVEAGTFAWFNLAVALVIGIIVAGSFAYKKSRAINRPAILNAPTEGVQIH